jgi:hypothetical protein
MSEEESKPLVTEASNPTNGEERKKFVRERKPREPREPDKPIEELYDLSQPIPKVREPRRNTSSCPRTIAQARTSDGSRSDCIRRQQAVGYGSC